MVNANRLLGAVAFAGLAAAASLPTSLPSGWVYDGCYSDNTYPATPRALGGRPTGNDGVAYNNRYSPNGFSNCLSKCQALAPGTWTYIGTADNQCWCDQTINANASTTYGQLKADSYCQQTCRGNANEICGSNVAGSLGITIYRYARTRPSSITGGCLCGAIRFTIRFPNDADWPPKGNGICQCTMCRKHSGSLLPQNISFPVAHLSPSLGSLPTYKTYASGPTTSRGFCSTCGSPLSFKDEKDTDLIEINIGAFDEEVLIGEKVEEEAWEDDYGRHVPRKGGWGYELGFPKYHIFAENEVKGVTDGFEGDKWLTDRTGGTAFKGKVGEMQRRKD